MSVAHPRDRSTGGEKDGNVGEKSKDDYRGVLDAVVFEDHDDFHDEPRNTGDSTAGVDSSEMLHRSQPNFNDGETNHTCRTEVQPRRNLSGVH